MFSQFIVTSGSVSAALACIYVCVAGASLLFAAILIARRLRLARRWATALAVVMGFAGVISPLFGPSIAVELSGGCLGRPTDRVEAIFQEARHGILARLGARAGTTEGGAVRISVPPKLLWPIGTWLGFCVPSKKLVMVSPWLVSAARDSGVSEHATSGNAHLLNGRYDQLLRLVIYHELLHCVAGLNHDAPVSLMNDYGNITKIIQHTAEENEQIISDALTFIARETQHGGQSSKAE